MKFHQKMGAKYGKKSFEITLQGLHTIVQFISVFWDKIKIYIISTNSFSKTAFTICFILVEFDKY